MLVTRRLQIGTGTDCRNRLIHGLYEFSQRVRRLDITFRTFSAISSIPIILTCGRRMYLTSTPELFVAIFLVVWKFATALTDVRHLTGNADYRYVSLNWEYDVNVPQLTGFQIRYCELQAWGPNRCRTMNVDSNDTDDEKSKNRKSKPYSVMVTGLRMATNYSFEVRPLLSRRNDREYYPSKSREILTLSTKGFSAKASLCLPHESEIEVSTGPYFAGRIAVEAADGERCVLDGDPNSPRDIYTLRIRHDLCGSTVNETTVSTFVLVQENLPILTHSTRRFLVLCTYQPDTLTVRARINLPASKNHEDELGVGNRVDVEDRAVPDFHDGSGDDIKVMRLQQSRKNEIDLSTTEIIHGGPIAQFVLMMVVIVAGVGGVVIVILWSLRRRNVEEDVEDSSSCNESLREPSEINFEIESVCGVKENISFENRRKHF